MVRIGTAHFVSKVHAVRYYVGAGGYCGVKDAMDAVNRKLAAGEIHIGRPDLKRGETLRLIDDDTRYAIEFCDHNEMVPNESPTHAWKCATCGYVYNNKESQ
jgi:hypothetical protein